MVVMVKVTAPVMRVVDAAKYCPIGLLLTYTGPALHLNLLVDINTQLILKKAIRIMGVGSSKSINPNFFLLLWLIPQQQISSFVLQSLPGSALQVSLDAISTFYSSVDYGASEKSY